MVDCGGLSVAAANRRAASGSPGSWVKSVRLETFMKFPCVALLLLLLGGICPARSAAPSNPSPAVRPRLQIINGSAQSVDIFWLKSDTERVPSGSIAPSANTVITTTLGHRFAKFRNSRVEGRCPSEVEGVYSKLVSEPD